ncbi:ferredoxin-2 [Anaeramoeba flamelloides]|uniref:Ferredoxin-2 n=1 Tax=Anaeramoeba flamelloides TaxID=1746091 RepID=A0AAV8A947_9EUKA|nr:ferredoxin-2 [Anaeramoeba flamelloides]
MSLSLFSNPKTLKFGSQLLTNTLFRNFSKANKKKITLIFEDEKGTQSKAVGKVGSTVLDIARSNKIRLHGACEGSSKCGTCHVYIKDPKFFDLFEEPSNTEFDVLDEVFQPRINSRLSSRNSPTYYFCWETKTRSPEDKYAQSLDECLGVLYSKIQEIEHFQVRDDESDDESKNKNKNKKKFSNFFYFFKGDRTMEQEITKAGPMLTKVSFENTWQATRAYWKMKHEPIFIENRRTQVYYSNSSSIQSIYSLLQPFKTSQNKRNREKGNYKRKMTYSQAVQENPNKKKSKNKKKNKKEKSKKTRNKKGNRDKTYSQKHVYIREKGSEKSLNPKMIKEIFFYFNPQDIIERRTRSGDPYFIVKFEEQTMRNRALSMDNVKIEENIIMVKKALQKSLDIKINENEMNLDKDPDSNSPLVKSKIGTTLCDGGSKSRGDSTHIEDTKVNNEIVPVKSQTSNDQENQSELKNKHNNNISTVSTVSKKRKKKKKKKMKQKTKP